ncbi:TPA: hypothetical protein GRR58_24815 [Vibrio parahaemolyticus]|nr:hypothetical protein [Vibrio parahaemolyticus]HAS6511322.1 hypothetical protein [Vibrio parahaemolyticus]HAS6516202.1 hypothetical protein [Vibrio parahaemolyticus]HAS6526197.1 hypothetical protein [Vibrio parahaemolyticus]HAS6541028.1 hypothetical protein [Vibrio parahaemolyticus]
MLEEVFKSRLFWFVVGAICTLFGVALKVYFANKSSNKKLFLENVTVERGKWREQLREEVSSFSALASKHYHSVKDLEGGLASKKFSLDIQELNELRVKVRLRLNPHENIDSYDTKLVRSMSRVLLQFEAQRYDRLDRELLRIERCTQLILKNEWDKSKREAITGKMEKSRHKSFT